MDGTRCVGGAETPCGRAVLVRWRAGSAANGAAHTRRFRAWRRTEGSNGEILWGEWELTGVWFLVSGKWWVVASRERPAWAGRTRPRIPIVCQIARSSGT